MKTMKTIEKKCAKIVKTTTKTAKKNPVAAVAIGGSISAIATSAIAGMISRSARHSFAAISSKRSAKTLQKDAEKTIKNAGEAAADEDFEEVEETE